ncbi:hypothetical protein D3C73_1408850 [compost metagenome]
MAIGQEVDFFLRKVDRRFDINPQADQLFREVMHTRRKGALQGAQCVASCLCRTGFDQVGDGFGLGQVELVVQKCPFTEFTRPGQAATQFKAALQQHIQDDRTTVPL